MEIDRDLEEHARRNPDRPVNVIIICRDVPPSIEAQLQNAGVVITGREQAEHGILYARVLPAALAALRHIAGLESVTLDSIQRAL